MGHKITLVSVAVVVAAISSYSFAAASWPSPAKEFTKKTGYSVDFSDSGISYYTQLRIGSELRALANDPEVKGRFFSGIRFQGYVRKHMPVRWSYSLSQLQFPVFLGNEQDKRVLIPSTDTIRKWILKMPTASEFEAYPELAEAAKTCLGVRWVETEDNLPLRPVLHVLELVQSGCRYTGGWKGITYFRIGTRFLCWNNKSLHEEHRMVDINATDDELLKFIEAGYRPGCFR